MKTMTFSVNLLRVKLLLGVFLRKRLTFEYLTEVLTQPASTCSKFTIQTLEQIVKYVQS